MQSISNQRIGRLLSEAYGLWQTETYAMLSDLGFPEVRPSHSPIFRHIDPDGSRTVDLAARASMTKQSMAYLVNSLETAGLVRLSPDPTDARARLVRLTDRGKEASDALTSSSLKVEARLSRAIGESEVECLRSLLGQLLTCGVEGQRR